MKLSSRIPIVALLLVIGSAGFMVGRISSPTKPGDDATAGQAETRSKRFTPETSSDGSNSAAERMARRPARPDAGSSPVSPDELARLDTIARSEDPLARNRSMLAFIDRLGPGDFEQAVAHFRSLGITESRLGEYALLLSAWAKMDPVAALDYAKANTNGGFATNTVLTTWASNDPDAALRWAEASHQGDGANPYLAGIIRGIAETNPERATQILTGMPKSMERGEALDAILPHLLSQGNDATRAWITAITDESLRNGAMMRAADKLAATDPAGTVDWLVANPSEATQRRMDDVYSTWANQDEKAALSSLVALPSGENRSNALRGVISSVASKNPQAAVSLLNQFPNDVNDRVVRNLIWHSFGSEPSIAASQIARITDEPQRNQFYNRLLGAWTERDPAAANTWIQNNSLPPSVLENLQR